MHCIWMYIALHNNIQLHYIMAARVDIVLVSVATVLHLFRVTSWAPRANVRFFGDIEQIRNAVERLRAT